MNTWYQQTKLAADWDQTPPANWEEVQGQLPQGVHDVKDTIDFLVEQGTGIGYQNRFLKDIIPQILSETIHPNSMWMNNWKQHLLHDLRKIEKSTPNPKTKMRARELAHLLGIKEVEDYNEWRKRIL
jgi:hypothetical protein